MDLNEYFLPLKKWWWLLLMATLVAGITSLGVAMMQPHVYQAHTTLIVGRTLDNPNPNSGDFYLEQSLAGAYADMSYREPVRNATMEALGLNWLPDYNAQVIPNSQLLEIQVTDSNPLRAQMVAKELAHQLILRSPTGSLNVDQARQSFIDDQLNSLQGQITDTEAEIKKLQNQLGALNSAKQISDAQGQINALQAKLSTLQANYANLLANTQKGAVNSLSIIEPAELPTSPISQNKVKVVGLAALIGLVLAAGGAYTIEFFDRTIKTRADVLRVFQTPVLGYIAEIEKGQNSWSYLLQHPRTTVAEAFRSLRGNIEFATINNTMKTLYIASIDAGAGKTTISLNLAIAFANIGKKVLLIDADLYRPKIHELFHMSSGPGLSEVLNGQSTVGSVVRNVEENKNLAIITAGNLNSNLVEFKLQRIEEILTLFRKVADIVIVDGPPFLIPDASLLASKVDNLILVIRPGQTREDVASAAMEQIRRSGAHLLGVVFNRITRKDAEAYGGYLFYSPYNAGYKYYGEVASEQANNHHEEVELTGTKNK